MSESDTQRLSRWFDLYAPAMVLYAGQWLDRPAAEDVVQDVFLKCIAQSAFAGVNEPNNEKAWLYSVVRNRAIDKQRQQAARLRRELQSIPRQSWFHSTDDDQLDAKLAQKALSKLPDEIREIIVLRIWGQMSLADISSVVGMPVSTVHDRYKQGLAALKNIMEPNYAKIKS